MNKLPIIIIGAGGHAKVLIDTLLMLDEKILGIVDEDEGKIGTEILDIPVIGNDSLISNYSVGEIVLVNGIGSIQYMNARKNVYDKFKNGGYSFLSIIHPSAIIGRQVTLEEGVQIMAGTIIQIGSYIGSNSIINTRVTIDHDCMIGKHVHIAPGTVLSGSVEIGEEVHIGTGSAVIQNIHIGSHSTIGAGSVVVKSMPENIVAWGVPAKVIQKDNV